ncbi:hypothetical protein JIG36_32115 [Actinoplanes sp. LDG1-06]|uniref:Uncharacterized protein n=1 Tax=Paractinoplanes ovalisporus TaxID=2810368 RepID=A0ABS2AK26_9ACTN|nr:hypothetical protein [Actinoplanes ovalisporus]MBM2620170.1 hypothetical protein [Actinoplanes ovalisporus]
MTQESKPIVPQAYPLFAATVFRAGNPNGTPACQREPLAEDVAVSRVIAWRHEDGAVPVPVTVEHGQLLGYGFTLFETASAAERQARHDRDRLAAYSAAHEACDDVCLVVAEQVEATR